MRESTIARHIAFLCTVLLLLLPIVVHAQEGDTTRWAEESFTDATDEELVAVLSSTRVDEALRALAECIDQYSEETPIDEVERLIPEFRTALGDDYIWGTKNSILKRVRRYAEEGQTESVKDSLRHLPDILGTAGENAVREARYVLEERALRYGEEGLNDDAERLTRLLVRVVEDSSLAESRRLEALTVLETQARFETTPDAVFDIARRLVSEDSSAGVRRRALQILYLSRRRDAIGVFETACRVLMEDPSVEVRYSAVQVLKESRRPEAEAIPFLEKAVLDERNAVEIRRGRSVQRAAIEVLGECGPDAAAFLLGLMSNDTFTPEDGDVTIRALARTGSAAVALPELLKTIETGDETEMRSAVLGLGLGLHEYPADARSAIMDVLRAGLHHPNDSRRRATCTALKYTGDFYLIPLIEPLLDDPLVRPRAQSAIKALRFEMTQYRQSEGIPDEERDMSIDEVIDHWGQKGWVTDAIRLRCRLADDETRNQIYDKLAALAIEVRDTDGMEREGARTTALTILGQQREHRDDAVRAVLEVLGATQSPITREGCYSALGRLGGPEAVQVLKEAILKDPPHERGPRESYFNLYSYLASCGPEAAPVLLQNADELDTASRTRLYRALGRTGNEMVIPYLLEQAHKALVAGEADALAAALRAACYRAHRYAPETRQQIADALVENADSTAPDVRWVVARGLEEVGDSAHIPLLESMAAEDPYVLVEFPTNEDGERTEKVVYPLREVAAKSIENIRRRLAEEQEATPQ